MNKTAKTLLISGGILLVLIILEVINLLRPSLNKNPDNFIGNSASNLYNGGTFCEYDGKVYFSNSNDGDALYVMNADETKASKLRDISVLSINADPHRIYYSMAASTNGTGLGYIRKASGLYSISNNGGRSTCYTTNPVAGALLYGNTLYYKNYEKTSGTTIYSISTERDNDHEIIKQLVNLYNPVNDVIYFGNMDNNHFLYAYDTVTESIGMVLEKDMYMPLVDGDWVYYMDPTDNYSLKRCMLSTGEEQLLADERLEFFNKYGDFIYYQTNKNPALKRMFYDGSNDTTIAEGIYTDLQTTSNYVYFRSYENPTITYHASHYGSINVEPFYPSK